MSECSVCGNSISVWKQVKFMDGALCPECQHKIPQFFKKQMGNMTLTSIKHLMEYEEKEFLKNFQVTASYGMLHIDEMHGLFCITDKLEGDKPAKDDPCVFYVLDLGEVGLFCVDAKANRKNVLVNVKMQCKFPALALDFGVLIKEKVPCNFKQVTATQVEYNEPGDFSMFRNMFNQMWKNENFKLKQKYEHNFLSKQEIDIFKARCLFMLEESFTKEELKKQRNTLIKAYHSDVSGDSRDFYTRKINEAYRLLQPLAEGSGSH